MPHQESPAITPLSTKKVPMLDLRREYQYLKEEIDRALARVLRHQTWILGPEVEELECRVADFLGTRFAIAVASGTDALVLALRSLALKLRGEEFWRPDDEIITTPFTFAATGDAILRAGATPVFVDIEPESFNLDPGLVEAALTRHTIGLLPVHLYGRPCAVDRLRSIAAAHGLFIVEDVAQAFGASHDGRRCGSWGDAAALSFFPSKNLGGFGDGGMVTTNDEAIARYGDILRRHGGRDKYNVEILGYNSRLDTIQAAILLVKLNHLEEFNRRRQAIARFYSAELAHLPGVVVPGYSAGHVFHQFTIRCRNRDRLAARLRELGIATMVYYPVPLHRMKVFEGRCRINGPLTQTERACQEVLSLPIEPLLEPWELERVVQAFREAMETIDN